LTEYSVTIQSKRIGPDRPGLLTTRYGVATTVSQSPAGNDGWGLGAKEWGPAKPIQSWVDLLDVQVRPSSRRIFFKVLIRVDHAAFLRFIKFIRLIRFR
jgi:hypothetical protein